MRRWQIDIRIAGAGLLAAAAALTVLLVAAPPATVDVLVAGSPLPSGVRMRELDIVVRPVEDPAGLIEAGNLDSLADHVLVAPLGSGSPIPESLLVAATGSGAPDLIGLDLEAAAAVQGLLEPGDLVDVYAASGDSGLIAASVPVAMVEVDNGALGTAQVRLVLAVDESTAPLLIAATSGPVHLVRRGS